MRRMAAIASPSAKPIVNERPARSRKTAAHSVVVDRKNSTSKTNGTGMEASRTETHGACWSKVAVFVSLPDNFPVV